VAPVAGKPLSIQKYLAAVFTVFGATGQIGRSLVARLRERGEHVYAPARHTDEFFNRPLGRIIYCIGNDRYGSEPLAVVETHVSILCDILERCDYESFLYLSTTRVYMASHDTNEQADIRVNPLEPSHLYNLTKLTGESICLSIPNERVRIVRLSNVTGINPNSHYFLPSLVRDALTLGEINLYLRPNSAKDYIRIEDVGDLIIKIDKSGTQRLYNVASGANISAHQIVEILQRETGCEVHWHQMASSPMFSPIDITRIRNEFGFRPKSVLDHIPEIIRETRRVLLPTGANERAI
jgi:nucleoside-diphosphate-sugar epimerase